MKKETKRSTITLITLIAIITGISLYTSAAPPIPPVYPPQQIQVPANGIILWPGTLDTVPEGWALCDGNNGTPDLRNVFVIGAGDQYSVGDTGGAITTTHDHAINITQAGVEGGTFVYATATRTEPQVLDNRPPYHALYFIMRLE